uniref:Ammonium transporter n=1 Tax=Chlamydomonas leiostraca TaxID=1034604 RepID=A0A7S0RVR0_9CHLO|mmetsp:Transcript_32928/g.83568  ORF Transcript_32928/g.83568 Transcript_32928/m.83568 type:complete len:502 (+) Transcript_32928:46-1551(+)
MAEEALAPWEAAGCPSEDAYDMVIKAFSNAEQVSVVCGLMTTADTASNNTSDLAYGLNSSWLVLCGALVFIMHGGFAMLCAGAIRSKNTLNILLQTIMDACVSGICFYTVGFAFAYGSGTNRNEFIGGNMFALARFKTGGDGDINGGMWTNWFYQWAFAATATTIPAGAVAERFNFNAYLAYTILVSAWVYPVVVHWVWDENGWLGAGRLTEKNLLFGTGMIDYAGSGVVHMVGGLTGLMGAWIVGPRLGRFDSNGNPVDMPGHSATLVVLGTVLLWFGWYGFNPGSTLAISTTTLGTIAARSAVTTTLSGCAGGISTLLNAYRRTKTWDLVCMCNGVLVGFVSITAGAHVLEPWAAIIAGLTGGLIFDGVCWIFLKLRIDDPLSAAPMHGFCGMWGVIMVGFLAKREYINEYYIVSRKYQGCFYPDSGEGKLLAAQIIGVLVITGWVCAWTGALFFILKALGMLRISEEDEHRGLDASKHGGSAYNTHDQKGSHTPQIKA